MMAAMLSPWLIAGLLALLAAAVLYFVFLPHVEGPSLDEQRPLDTAWLTECPQCGRWELRHPVASTDNEPIPSPAAERHNWYRCRECGHKWEEVHQR